MTSQQSLVCDNSTLTNFKQWAKAISDFFAAAGWVQSSDTGQVNWTSIASVPGSGAYVYEIWKPGDALTPFFIKLEYGNSVGANSPGLRITLSTATNGAGTPLGFIAGPTVTTNQTLTPPSTIATYDCYFSGSNNRMAFMMWRNAPNNVQQFIAVERSVDATGAYTGAYATFFTCGWVGGGSGLAQWSPCVQQSLVFAVGAAPTSGGTIRNQGSSGFLARAYSNNNQAPSGVFNASLPFDTPAPFIGYFDYPVTVLGVGQGADFPEAITFNVTLYGQTRTYMPSKTGPFQYCGTPGWTPYSLCMRYD